MHIQMILPFIDLSTFSSSKENSLSGILVSLKSVMTKRLRNDVFVGEMSRTSRDNKPSIRLSRTLDGISVFEQLSSQLKSIPGENLSHSSHSFSVDLDNESAQDAGGVFREVLCHAVDDLLNFESNLNIFTPTPNSVEGVGTLQDAVIFNLNSFNSDHLITLGKLIGIAIRTANHLSFCLPPFFWKKLVGSSVTLADYSEIDYYQSFLIDSLSDDKIFTHDQSLTKDNFADLIDHEFGVKLASGDFSNLSSHYNTITYSNKAEYVELAKEVLFAQFDRHIEEIQKGLTGIIPLYLLSLLTYSDIEVMVCGDPVIDIARLKSITHYGKGGFHPNSPYVLMFWSVLESFSQVQRQLFLRFVWGGLNCL
ncbi:hypothetical protein GEMRC1_002787 [Eukaryota sp. GEM-RC1]